MPGAVGVLFGPDPASLTLVPFHAPSRMLSWLAANPYRPHAVVRLVGNVPAVVHLFLLAGVCCPPVAEVNYRVSIPFDDGELVGRVLGGNRFEFRRRIDGLHPPSGFGLCVRPSGFLADLRQLGSDVLTDLRMLDPDEGIALHDHDGQGNNEDQSLQCLGGDFGPQQADHKERPQAQRECNDHAEGFEEQSRQTIGLFIVLLFVDFLLLSFLLLSFLLRGLVGGFVA